MVQVVWSQRALADLGKINEYIGLFSPEAAERITRRLWEASERLAQFPEIGRAISPTRRELVIVRPYILRYRVRANRVTILTVWHGARERGRR